MLLSHAARVLPDIAKTAKADTKLPDRSREFRRGGLTLALLASTALVAVSASPAAAASAQWSPTAATGDFNTGSNWSTNAVPTDTAFFVQSAITSLTLSATTALGELHLDPGAANYDLATQGHPFTLNGAGIVIEGGSLTLHTNGGGLSFSNAATAGASTISNNGGNVLFFGTSTAGSAIIHNFSSGTVQFVGTDAGSATIDNAASGQIIFSGAATAGNAKLSNAAGSGATSGTIDISGVTSSISVGSISGGGLLNLGAKNLNVGANNQDGQFDGVVQGASGTLTKLGTGTFTLTGNNTYGGGTLLNGGTLVGTSSTAFGTNTIGILGGTLAVTTADELTIANPIHLTGSGTLQNRSSGNFVTFSGGISGGGNLTLDSRDQTSVIFLLNTNTYTGSTTITSGSKALLGNSNGSITGSITASSQLNNNGIFFINTGSSATFGSVLNTGFIRNLGVFNDDLNNTGTFSNTGTFVGNIASNTGTFTNDSGATVTGNVNNAGTFVNNGTVTGTLNVTGGGTLTGTGMLSSLAFASGAIYLVTINGATATNTTVTGTATLNGTVTASALTRLAATTTYTIVNAGTLVGTFSGATSANNFVRNARLSYSGTSVFLTVDPGLLTPNLPGSASVNQRNVAAGIDNAATASMPAGFNTLFALPGSALPGALTQISGETATGSQQATFQAMNQFMGVMTDPFIAGRGDNIAGGSGATPFADEADAANAYAAKDATRSKSERDAYAAIYRKAPVANVFSPSWSVWGAGFGGSQTTSGNAALGSNNASSSIAGTAAGADYRFSPFTIAGFALAGGGTSFSVANGGSGRSDLFQAGAFIRHTVGAAYVSGALAYGWQDITTNRTVTVAGIDQLRAEFNANAFSGRVEGGYRYVTPWAGGLGITPYAAAQFTTFDLPTYAEGVVSGAGTFALAYGAKSVTDPRSELGLRSDKSWAMPDGVLTLRGRLAWAHDYDPNRAIGATFQALPGSSFVVNGAAQASDSALVTAAVEKKWLNGWSAAATFEGEFSQVTSSYAGKGVVRYTW